MKALLGCLQLPKHSAAFRLGFFHGVSLCL